MAADVASHASDASKTVPDNMIIIPCDSRATNFVYSKPLTYPLNFSFSRERFISCHHIFFDAFRGDVKIFQIEVSSVLGGLAFGNYLKLLSRWSVVGVALLDHQTAPNTVVTTQNQ